MDAVAIQLVNIDPILIDGLHLSPQKHCWTAERTRSAKIALSPIWDEEGEADKWPNVAFQQENGWIINEP